MRTTRPRRFCCICYAAPAPRGCAGCGRRLRGMSGQWAMGNGQWPMSSNASSDLWPLDSRPRLIRPLLQVTREEIERYCSEHNLEPRRDPSNFELDATRNRLRHDLLPRLIEYNPHIVAALGR